MSFFQDHSNKAAKFNMNLRLFYGNFEGFTNLCIHLCITLNHINTICLVLSGLYVVVSSYSMMGQARFSAGSMSILSPIPHYRHHTSLWLFLSYIKTIISTELSQCSSFFKQNIFWTYKDCSLCLFCYNFC